MMPSSPTLFSFSSPSSPRAQFELSTERDGDRLVVHLHGALDAAMAPLARATFGEIEPGRYRQIELDASALDIIDSVGVGLIVSLYKRARLTHTPVVITGLRHQPHAILKLLRLDRLFVPAA